jgi:hypothetical protein
MQAFLDRRAGYKCFPLRGRCKTVCVVTSFVSSSSWPQTCFAAGPLIAENALLRQQLIVAERKLVGRFRWTPWQRFTIVLAARMAPAWREATLLIQPATILRWHRGGFRAFLAASLSSSWRLVEPRPEALSEDPKKIVASCRFVESREGS